MAPICLAGSSIIFPKISTVTVAKLVSGMVLSPVGLKTPGIQAIREMVKVCDVEMLLTEMLLTV